MKKHSTNSPLLGPSDLPSLGETTTNNNNNNNKPSNNQWANKSLVSATTNSSQQQGSFSWGKPDETAQKKSVGKPLSFSEIAKK